MISTEKYLEGVESIYVEQPDYENGHDGSDGKCDCIGMCKGAIRRAGGDASGLSGTNYAARHTIENMRSISSASDLSLGDVVLKGRQPTDTGYDLPEKYRIGGNDFNGDLTDYYHIGTVTGVNPLEITHMTSPKPKKDIKLGKWGYAGWLPQVKKSETPPEPVPDPEPEKLTAIVVAPSGSNVNMRRSPNKGAALVERVPIGATVEVITKGQDWSQIRWKKYTGWMMSQYLAMRDDDNIYEYCTVTITGLSEAQAEILKQNYPQAIISRG